MNDFTINTEKLNKSIEDYKISRSNLLEEINSSYESLKNVDVAWNDSNSIVFLETLKNDKFVINNFFEDFDKLYVEIENFKNSINSICNKYSYNSNGVLLRFKEYKINQVIIKLNNVKEYLNNAIYYINLCDFDEDYSLKRKANYFVNNVKNIRNLVNEIINKINNFKREINNILNDYHQNFSKIKIIDMNIKSMDFIWKTTNPELRSVNLVENKKYNQMNSKISLNSNNTVLQNDSLIANENNIKLNVSANKLNNSNYMNVIQEKIETLDNSELLDNININDNESVVSNSDLEINKSTIGNYEKQEYFVSNNEINSQKNDVSIKKII